MASSHASIHLHPEDQPFVQRLESGSIAVWVEGKHIGPTVIGRDEALTKVRDAIDLFLAADEAASRAVALSDLAAAPDLLEALKDALLLLPGDAPEYAAGRAAIAKAEGRS